MSDEYHIIRELEHNPAHTQRSLAEALEMSLGKANYVLAGLMQKGIVKAKRLRDEPGKIRWRYILTPKGMREKVRIAREYLQRRVVEYGRLREEIERLEAEVGVEAGEHRR